MLALTSSAPLGSGPASLLAPSPPLFRSDDALDRLLDAVAAAQFVRDAGQLETEGTAHRARSFGRTAPPLQDRKSTRLNSSHLVISYAGFCLKKKKDIRAVNDKKN